MTRALLSATHRSNSRLERLHAFLAAALLATAAACAERSEGPPAQRLVDAFSPAMVAGSPPAGASAPPAAEWRFDGPAPEPPTADWPATRGWQPLRDVDGLAVRDGRLTATTASGASLLRLVRESGFDEPDLLHEVRVRLTASAGTEVSMHLIGAEEQEFDRAALTDPQIPLPMTAVLEPGGEPRDYVLTGVTALRGGEVRQILLRPTDAAGATFEIESVRLVYRREHLAGTASGLGWHGLSDAYRETVVARSPETLRWEIDLPARPQLDLALGTLDARPVTFRVTLSGPGGAGEAPLLERTLTTPHRWEVASLDLAAWGGRRAALTLSVDAGDAGTLGLWGSVAVRRRGAPTLGAPSGGAGGPAPKVVLFILTDTLRRDRLDAYGHERATAPTLARLAAEGTLFSDAVAQGTWTKVSLPSMMTSRYVSSTGVKEFEDRLPSAAVTLAEVYREAGYATAGWASIPFAGRGNNLHQGYEELHERAFELGSSKTARGFVDRLLPWLERHREVPAFVFLHVLDPHNPYRPESPYDTKWADPAGEDAHRRIQAAVQPHVAHPMRKMLVLPWRDELAAAGVDAEAFVGRELDFYDGSIRAMDAELGRVFERLRELGLDRETLTVVASDHGEEFLDHGRMFHGHSVYAELTQVPMLFRYPGVVPAGARIEETVQLIDLMPTLLELSGLPLPEGAQGQSAVTLLARAAGGPERLDGDGRRWQPRPAISEKPAARSPFVPPPRETESTAIVFDGWKLIHNSERPVDAPEYELYDHLRDPHDRHDVADRHPDVVERLAGLLDAWRRTAAADRLPSDEEAAQDLSRDELERLRALGYVE